MAAADNVPAHRPPISCEEAIRCQRPGSQNKRCVVVPRWLWRAEAGAVGAFAGCTYCTQAEQITTGCEQLDPPRRCCFRWWERWDLDEWSSLLL